MTPTDFEKINCFIDKMDSNIVIEAIKEASPLNKRSTKYIEVILSNWLKSGVTNMNSLHEYRDEYARSKSRVSKTINEENTSDKGEYDDITICY